MSTVRILLPQPLQLLARAPAEVQVEVGGPVTTTTIVRALEGRYPMLCGAILDHTTGRRRPMIRFYACSEDLSHSPPDQPVPDAVASGHEPLRILGAIAGG